ncbi:glycoside hydrolase family 99-like domain-containing protein [Parapedobacter sp. GCM10030251]|uniref:glycoside hydrolase family 99-like domain-containing protein n=1 Tax=Parapedobacter sp. GCM10030251 TaxID=3273419 RepID=UPI0036082FBB
MNTPNIKQVVASLAVGLALAACQKNEPTPIPDFDYDIPPTELGGDVHVGAYYTVYDSISAADAERSFSDAEAAGLDYFVLPYTSAASAGAIDRTLEARNGSRVKWVINYSLGSLNATNGSPLAGAKLETLKADFAAFAATYFGTDAYYKIDGKPLIMINALNLSASQSQSIDFNLVAQELKATLQEAGFESFIVGEITTGWIPPQRYAAAVKAMDAVTLNNWATNNYDRSEFFPSFLDMNWKNWTDSLSGWGVDFVPNILPGYDDKHVNANSNIYDLERTPEFYADLCNVAKRNLTATPIILINSWNNQANRTGIEQKSPYGDAYLRITREQLSQ